MYDERKHNSEIKTAKRIGFEEGKNKGRAEGEYSKALSVAKNRLNGGVSIEKLSEMTGLSIEEIQM